jgi:hypothetical protein
MSAEKPITTAELTEGLKISLNELLAPAQFQELLDLAVDACLVHLPEEVAREGSFLR